MINSLMDIQKNLSAKIDRLKDIEKRELAMAAQMQTEGERLDAEIKEREANLEKVGNFLSSLTKEGYSAVTTNTESYKAILLKLLQEHGCEITAALESETDIVKGFKAAQILLNLRYSWNTVADYRREFSVTSSDEVREMVKVLNSKLEGIAEDISRSVGLIRGQLLEDDYLSNANKALNLLEDDLDWIIEGAQENLHSRLNKILFKNGVKPKEYYSGVQTKITEDYNYFDNISRESEVLTLLRGMSNEDRAAFILDTDERLIMFKTWKYFIDHDLLWTPSKEEQEKAEKDFKALVTIVKKSDKTKAAQLEKLYDEVQKDVDLNYLFDDHSDEGYQEFLIENNCVTSNNTDEWIKDCVANAPEIALLLISKEKAQAAKEQMKEAEAYLANSSFGGSVQAQGDELPF